MDFWIHRLYIRVYSKMVSGVDYMYVRRSHIKNHAMPMPSRENIILQYIIIIGCFSISLLVAERIFRIQRLSSAALLRQRTWRRDRYCPKNPKNTQLVRETVEFSVQINTLGLFIWWIRLFLFIFFPFCRLSIFAAEKQKLNCLMMLHFAFICVPMLDFM